MSEVARGFAVTADQQDALSDAIERAELAQAANRILAVWRLVHLMIGARWQL